ncbi:MAG TPA: flagellar biosynthesis anti-sigma factor FlgM [Bryobacteraceae bacterium]|nr:flagellar biosynthesis anti-sigma factor FlgM [Bryobacteraceae bacterium]
MRIDDKNLSSANAAGLGRALSVEQAEQAAQRAAAARAGASDQGDEVQLSSLAEKVQSLEPDSADSLAKLDQLSRLVASGKYSPDTAAVADRLIEDSLASKPTAAGLE